MGWCMFQRMFHVFFAVLAHVFSQKNMAGLLLQKEQIQERPILVLWSSYFWPYQTFFLC